MKITPEYQRILKRRKQREEVRALNRWKEAVQAEYEPSQHCVPSWFGWAVIGAWIAIVAAAVWATT